MNLLTPANSEFAVDLYKLTALVLNADTTAQQVEMLRRRDELILEANALHAANERFERTQPT